MWRPIRKGCAAGEEVVSLLWLFLRDIEQRIPRQFSTAYPVENAYSSHGQLKDVLSLNELAVLAIALLCLSFFLFVFTVRSSFLKKI